jgi:phosphonate transport system substrate-binding protein
MLKYQVQLKSLYNYFFLVTAICIATMYLTSCNSSTNKPPEHKNINLSDTGSVEQASTVSAKNTGVLRVAISSMTSPRETFTHYNELLNYIEEKLGKRVLLVQRRTYKEVNNLLKNTDVDFAFICTGAYIVGFADSAFSPLVKPTREGKNTYKAYLIVHKDSKIKSFSELKGKKFSFTDSLSTTGMYYPQKKLKDLKTNADDFFLKVYYSNAHDNSIELVSRKIVDAATVNSLIYDYQLKFTPEKLANVKIVELSELFGTPPVVISKSIDKETMEGLKDIFYNLQHNKRGQEILKGLMIDRYERAIDSDYANIRAMKEYIDKPNTK